MQPPTEPQRFLDELEGKLRVLPSHCQLAFGASVCERHFADYLAFHGDEQWGDPTSLREAVDMAWRLSQEHIPLPMQGLDELLARCMRAIPDTEDFQTGSVSYALDVGVMVLHLLEFMRNCDSREIVRTAAQARDLIDAKVQIREDLSADGVANHPLMVSEIKAMKLSLAKLQNIQDADGLTDFRHEQSEMRQN